MNRSVLFLCALASLSACGGSKPAPAPEAAAEATPSVEETVTAEVEATLDRSVAPCDDFYAFACGGWLSSFELPADRSRFSRSFSAISDRNQEIVKDILDNPAEGADPRLGAYYGACMDTDNAEMRGTAALESDLARIAAVEDAEGLLALLAELPLAGGFMGAFVEADFKNPDVNMLMVAQGGLGLPTRDDYFPQDEAGKELLLDYETHVYNMLELAGLDPAGAETVVAIETRLAEASRPPAALRDATTLYNPMDLAAMKALAPGFAWETLLQAHGLDTDITVNVMTPEFFTALSEVLAETPLEDLKTYLSWHLITGTAPYLTAALDAENFAFYGTRLSGQKEQEPRWKRCVSRTDGALGDLLGQAFVDRAFAGDSKAKALTMIQDVEKAFEQGLPELAWMDEETRAKALDKVHAITNKIGYPDRWEAYEGLEVGEDAYANAMATAAWEQADSLADVGQPVDKTEWFMSPPTVNAYYNPTKNEIVFPAAILQPPFFNAEADDAVNYGGIGAVIGHEISHGFDDQGSKYDGDGNLENWFTDNDLNAFRKLSGQLVNQYESYTVLGDKPLNGRLTLGENIADLSGMAISYKAYILSLEGQDAPVIDGFTGPQRFFLGWSQIWRRLYRDEDLVRRLVIDPHSPSQFRANGPVINFNPFYEAFDVKEGDKLYRQPDDRIQIW